LSRAQTSPWRLGKLSQGVGAASPPLKAGGIAYAPAEAFPVRAALYGDRYWLTCVHLVGVEIRASVRHWANPFVLPDRHARALGGGWTFEIDEGHADGKGEGEKSGCEELEHGVFPVEDRQDNGATPNVVPWAIDAARHGEQNTPCSSCLPWRPGPGNFWAAFARELQSALSAAVRQACRMAEKSSVFARRRKGNDQIGQGNVGPEPPQQALLAIAAGSIANAGIRCGRRPRGTRRANVSR
jgi:hypothetical protein